MSNRCVDLNASGQAISCDCDVTCSICADPKQIVHITLSGASWNVSGTPLYELAQYLLETYAGISLNSRYCARFIASSTIGSLVTCTWECEHVFFDSVTSISGFGDIAYASLVTAYTISQNGTDPIHAFVSVYLKIRYRLDDGSDSVVYFVSLFLADTDIADCEPSDLPSELPATNGVTGGTADISFGGVHCGCQGLPADCGACDSCSNYYSAQFTIDDGTNSATIPICFRKYSPCLWVAYTLAASVNYGASLIRRASDCKFEIAIFDTITGESSLPQGSWHFVADTVEDCPETPTYSAGPSMQAGHSGTVDSIVTAASLAVCGCQTTGDVPTDENCDALCADSYVVTLSGTTGGSGDGSWTVTRPYSGSECQWNNGGSLPSAVVSIIDSAGDHWDLQIQPGPGAGQIVFSILVCDCPDRQTPVLTFNGFDGSTPTVTIVPA